jgi:copper type II ascorbate-dependent monooxygenase-like protein
MGSLSQGRLLMGIGIAALQACAGADPAPVRHDAGGNSSPPIPPGVDASSVRDTSPGSTKNDMPCEVKRVVDAACVGCHGAPPKYGAPMSLVTWDDFHRQAVTAPQSKVYESADERIHRVGSGRMPQDRQLSPSELGALEAWFRGGAPPGGTCEGGTPDSGGAVDAKNDAVSPPPPPSDGGPVVGEECFEFRAHGNQTAGDTTPFSSALSEFYNCFNFKVPWTKVLQGTRFESMLDNDAVVHHWLLYQSPLPVTDGSFSACTGAHPGMALVTGWAPGGRDLQFPPDVGLELAAPGQSYQLEIHYYNSSAQTFQDRTGVRVCATANSRPNTASITWAGTERISIPARSQGTASGICTPNRKGLGASDPIHIMYQWPHGHRLLTRMQTIINRKGGMTETLHDQPFTFDNQTTYDTPALLYPGDTLTTSCWYNNTTGSAVFFGSSTTQEMCYAFLYAWPAHALDGRASLVGAANMCID